MDCQKHRFNLPAGVHYLNCASRGPFSRAVEAAGIEAIGNTTSQIHHLTATDFFEPAWEVRRLFANLIQASDPERVALVPSVSYAMSIVARNLPHKAGFARGQKIILLEGEFPSDVYAWERVAAEQGLTLQTVPMPLHHETGKVWNKTILTAIDSQTAMIVCPHVHWMYGFIFDLPAISVRAKEVGAWLIVDGTQSVGAFPFDFGKIQPDVLVCAGYKWLMGPYSLGLAYFNETFDDGIPLEETWMARQESHHFHTLTDYQATYRPKAYRYNVGEHSHFIQLPILKAALEQVLAWGPENIQAYCRELLKDAIPVLQHAGYHLEPEPYRAHHLVGVRLPVGQDVAGIQKMLSDNRVLVSARGQGLRVSPQVYNTPEDVEALVDALAKG
ncbi:aminotransferase class V-fold PLP-dependent enzyme [Salmonirosea aquatica]|uniref:Aminotransferase class V-fold PLP-dependent enzyme n=1 Tax=Salmonirosea aquatica TaxID=2654236 RepID=A0A7C9BF40_9BACT|nr:aminotransferase class V-fold PLP-dependent enzyme [Cytophagaceae bacterium SJW1-29]